MVRGGGRCRLLAVVLLVLALGGAGCQRGGSRVEPGGQAAGAPGASPLLRSHELGSGWRESVAAPAPPSWPWVQEDCPSYRDGDYLAQSHRRDAVQRFFHRDDTAVTAHQVVERYEPGWADRALDDVREVLRRCANYPVLGSQLSFRIVEAADLGAAGLVVRGQIDHAALPAQVSYFISVRRGDVVSTLNLPDPGDEATIRSLAATLADRIGSGAAAGGAGPEPDQPSAAIASQKAH
ncbi:hypothetical protein [Micromonospora sp. URMC 103]|uniref:hypothetical protein n=1 Tax=Micromonospora sp. URMC 103 TaxID=3423406 RepID=UPI003F199DC9